MQSPHPVLIIDLKVVRANIERMAEKASVNKIEFRPHFKTHQSRKIGSIFRDFGVEGITVSSLKMARYFAGDGWEDITIAFPVNLLAAGEYDRLAASCRLSSLVVSREVVMELDRKLNHQMGLYIEIDPDYGRSGVPVTETPKIEGIIEAIDSSEYLNFIGFYCHAGHTYKARSEEQILSISNLVMEKLQELKQHFPGVPICYGDTPSCSALQNLDPVDQISPGNFVFYDWMQVQIGACSPGQIAVQMECPVIEKYSSRKELLIHGGAVHFSKDQVDGGFGQVNTSPFSKQNFISGLSQEHGIVACTSTFFEDVDPGDKIRIFPVHSCLTADLMSIYYTQAGEEIDHMNKKKFT